MRFLSIVLLVLCLGIAAEPASAAMSREQAVRMVKQQTDGRILSVDTVRRGDRIIYRIKVLTPEGHVRVIKVDGGRVNNGDRGGRR
jgi:uncharacterized membrane protein YkoI